MMTEDTTAKQREAVTALYHQLLAAWNQRDAGAFASLFQPEGHTIGFDGSEMHGREAIAAALRQIFADHQTGAYVGIVREVQFLTPSVAVLRAAAGVIPAGQNDLNPALNAVQGLVAAIDHERWQIVLYQNTPAQYHGRPELVEALTAELRRQR